MEIESFASFAHEAERICCWPLVGPPYQPVERGAGICDVLRGPISAQTSVQQNARQGSRTHPELFGLLL